MLAALVQDRQPAPEAVERREHLVLQHRARAGDEPFAAREPRTVPAPAPRGQRHRAPSDAPALHGYRALDFAAPDLLDAPQRRERVHVVEQAAATRIAHAHVARNPARVRQNGGEGFGGGLRGQPLLLDEVAQKLGVHMRGARERLVGAHHHVLAPGAVLGVAPQQAGPFLRRRRAVELDRVLTAQLLGVRERGHG